MAHKYTLAEAVDKFYITQGIDRKKFFAKDLIRGGDVMAELNVNTLNVIKSVWLEVKYGLKYDYVDVPEDAERIYSLSIEDSCKNPVPLFFDKMFHVEHAPVKRPCGCENLADEVDGMTMTTKFAFRNGNVDYFEKEWIQLCPNGDMLKYREVPVKKFNDKIGDSGDHNIDFNEDFSVADGFANYEIVIQKLQEKVCNLSLKECGCPVDCPENKKLLIDHCGNFLNPALSCCKERCYSFLPEINPKRIGEATLSDCETKIFVRKLRKPAEFLLLTYQTNGRSCFSDQCVPEKALMALWTGIDYRKKMFSNKFSEYEKKSAEYRHNDAKDKLVAFDNKLSLEFLSTLSNTKIKW